MARGDSIPNKGQRDCGPESTAQTIRCKLAPDSWVQNERTLRWTAGDVRKQVVDFMREQHQRARVLWGGREPRLQEQATADYDFDTYLDIMAHPGTPFGKLEYLAAAALEGTELQVHRDGKQTVAFGNAKEVDYLWLQHGHI